MTPKEIKIQDVVYGEAYKTIGLKNRIDDAPDATNFRGRCSPTFFERSVKRSEKLLAELGGLRPW
jgi:hypothetical protein